MQKIKFWKMSGAGNDFVLLTGGRFDTAALKKLAVGLCARRRAVGADGLLYANKDGKDSLSVRYFNSDGSEAFCGNGSRCSAWWAHSSGLVKNKKFRLKTISGALPAEITGRESVKMRMPDVARVRLDFKGKYPPGVKLVHFLNTGVPHAVVPVDGLEKTDVRGLGRALRFNRAFGPEGANVDFVKVSGGRALVRTYERGVEDETPACGTGIAASAIALGLGGGLRSPVKITSRSGERFKVWYKPSGGRVTEIYLQGPAKIVFEGQVTIPEALC